MSTTIIHKIGSGVPDATDLVVGEIAQDENTGTLYVKKSDGSVAPVGSDSAGAGMVISADEPADPATGLQWLESTTGRVWIWDEDKWLEFPAASPQSAPVIVSEDEPADPVIGQLWYKPSEGAMYVYDGSDWQAFGSGGDGGGDGGDVWDNTIGLQLISGGGGSRDTPALSWAYGGGGAGAFYEALDFEVETNKQYDIVIGAGGAMNTIGGTSRFLNAELGVDITITGGQAPDQSAVDGSGGGGKASTSSGKSGGSGGTYGNNGGNGASGGAAGGGGGAGAAAENSPAVGVPSDGGLGIICFDNARRAGGGGGAASTQAAYGKDGGGNGAIPKGIAGAGQAFTGGGAGGTCPDLEHGCTGNSGGSGVAFIKTTKKPAAVNNGLEITNPNGDGYLYKFKNSGSITF